MIRMKVTLYDKKGIKSVLENIEQYQTNVLSICTDWIIAASQNRYSNMIRGMKECETSQ